MATASASSQKIYKVGLVGFGMVSEVFHAPLVSAHPRFRLGCVVERSGSKSQKRYSGVTVVTSLEALLETDVEVVVIATPSGSHYQQALLALGGPRVRAVIVEKPFTVHATEADDLIETAARNNKLLTVFQNRRYDSDFQTVHSVVLEGLLGTLTEIEIHYDRYRPNLKPGAWREQDVPGAGILYDLGSHLVDQAVTLAGQAPTAVLADVRAQRAGAVVNDYFDLDLRFAGLPHLKVTLRAGMLVREGGPRYVLHGTRGSFVKRGMDVQEEQLKAGKTPALALSADGATVVETSGAWGAEGPETQGDLFTSVGSVTVRGKVETQAGRYYDFYTEVAQALDSGSAAALGVPAWQARNVVAVLEAAALSAAQGQLVGLEQRLRRY